MRRRYMMVFAAVIILLGVLATFGNVPLDIISKLYLFTFVAGIIIMMTLYYRWIRKLMKRLNEYVPLLETDPDAYIAGMNEIINDGQDKKVASILRINIAWGECAKGDFEAARETMLSIPGNRLKKNDASVYLLNLAYVLVQADREEDKEKAYDIIIRNKKRFLTLPAGGNLPLMTAFVIAYTELEKNEWQTAKKRLEDARETWGMEVPGMDYTLLEERIRKYEADADVALPEEPEETEEPII